MTRTESHKLQPNIVGQDVEAIAALHKVTQNFGASNALEEIDLAIYPGDRVALIGSSGAGKSTLLRILNGQQIPTIGEVYIFGQALNQLRGQRRRRLQQRVGLVPQQFHLIPPLSVLNNVNAGNLGRWPMWKAALSLLHPWDRQAAEVALHQVQLGDKVGDRAANLSGGQQQRVAIARILVQDPPLILADEPIASLDPALSHTMMQLLCDLCTHQGKTLVMSLHSVEFARQYCQRLVGVRGGRIVFDAPVAEVSEEMVTALYGEATHSNG